MNQSNINVLLLLTTFCEIGDVAKAKDQQCGLRVLRRYYRQWWLCLGMCTVFSCHITTTVQSTAYHHRVSLASPAIYCLAIIEDVSGLSDLAIHLKSLSFDRLLAFSFLESPMKSQEFEGQLVIHNHCPNVELGA